VDGFRLDAVKHIDSDFYPIWLKTMREIKGEEFFSVGEYWNGDRNILENYLDAVGRCMSLFDVPLHFNFHHASLSNGQFDMSKLLEGSLVETDPEIAVTFVDNHDTQAGQSLESSVAEWFLPHAYSVILLRSQGYPCIFYGDYYGLASREGRNYQDMINLMIKLRKERLYGEQHDYFDDPDVVGWTLEGDPEHKKSGYAVIMTNREAGAKKMYVGKHHSGETWKSMLSDDINTVKIDEEGNGVFYCEAGSLSIWSVK
jgi:alpha-amylase